MSEQSESKELTPTPELNKDTREGVSASFKAITDALNNQLMVYIGNQELREMGISDDVPTTEEDHKTMLAELEQLSKVLGVVAKRAASPDKPIPIIDKGVGPMIDLDEKHYPELDKIT